MCNYGVLLHPSEINYENYFDMVAYDYINILCNFRTHVNISPLVGPILHQDYNRYLLDNSGPTKEVFTEYYSGC